MILAPAGLADLIIPQTSDEHLDGVAWSVNRMLQEPIGLTKPPACV